MSNNIYGKCCNCPARMNDGGRGITNYRSSRVYHAELADELKAGNSNDLRELMQRTPGIVRRVELQNSEGCKGPRFNVDSSNFHKLPYRQLMGK